MRAFGFILLLVTGSMAQQEESLPSIQEIVLRMTEMNEARAAALHAYHNTRTYEVSYRGFPKDLSAKALVQVDFTEPDTKKYTIVKQEGSGLLVNRVIKKALESEEEAAKPEFRRRSALNDINYTFQFLGNDSENGRPCYLLQVKPKREDKYLYDGKICVDMADYAVARIEAKPAKNPSFWINKANIDSQSRKVGEFWFPASLHSTSHVRLGGDAEMKIDYGQVEVTSASPMQAPAH